MGSQLVLVGEAVLVAQFGVIHVVVAIALGQTEHLVGILRCPDSAIVIGSGVLVLVVAL